VAPDPPLPDLSRDYHGEGLELMANIPKSTVTVTDNKSAVPKAKVGIALAAYAPNPEFFAAQLNSLLSQTCQDWICHIRLDSPLEDLRRVWSGKEVGARFFTDSRFLWSENPARLGHRKNFEACIGDVARHDDVRWIFCCDQDDIWKPEKISTMVAALAVAPPLSLAHSDMIISRDGSMTNSPSGDSMNKASIWRTEHRQVQNNRPQHFLVHNIVTGAAAAFDADLARRFPVLADAVDFHDHWFGLVASCSGSVVAIPEPLVIYRQHGDNVVGAREYRHSYLPGDDMASARARALDSWKRSHALLNAVLRQGIALPFWVRAVFGRAPDFGFGLLMLALLNGSRDGKYARECVIRAIGKALWCLKER